MKKNLIKTIVCIGLTVLLTACPTKDHKSKVDGGGDYGGGDLRLKKVEKEKIVPLINRAFGFMEFYFNLFESTQYFSVSTKKSAQSFSMGLLTKRDVKKFHLASDKLYKNDRIFKVLKNTKLVIKEKGNCSDRNHRIRDGSAVQKGQICIDAKRIRKKVHDLHAWSSIVGLLAHEFVHKVGGNEKEAIAFEKLISLNIKDDVSDDDFIEEVKSFIQYASSLDSYVNELKELIENQETDPTNSIESSVCNIVTKIKEESEGYVDQIVDFSYKNLLLMMRNSLYYSTIQYGMFINPHIKIFFCDADADGFQDIDQSVDSYSHLPKKPGELADTGLIMNDWENETQIRPIPASGYKVYYVEKSKPKTLLKNLIEQKRLADDIANLFSADKKK